MAILIILAIAASIVLVTNICAFIWAIRWLSDMSIEERKWMELNMQLRGVTKRQYIMEAAYNAFLEWLEDHSR